MPRYKRYGPISHDINADAEVWEFTKLFGDRSYRTLVEVLMIIDRHENRWRMVGDWSGNLSRKVRQSVANVRRQIRHMVAVGWLLVEETAADGSPLVVSAAKYAEYHRSRETKKQVHGTTKGNKQTTFRVPPILSYPNLTYSSSKEEEGAREKEPVKPEDDLGLGQRHPAALVGWPLWSKLETFWRAEGKRIGVIQLEMHGQRLIDYQKRGHDPVAVVELALRNGWKDLYEPEAPAEPPGQVYDFEAIRARAAEAAAKARNQ